MDRSSNIKTSSPETNEEFEQINSEYYCDEKKLRQKLIEEQEKQLNYKLNEINKHIETFLEKYKQLKDENFNELITVLKSKYSEGKYIKELNELFLNNEIFNAKIRLLI